MTTRRAGRSHASSRRAASGSRGDRRRDRAPSLGARRRTWSCWIWACPTSTGSRSFAGSGATPTTPIVILSGRYEEREKVEALDRGADDYVTKPFGVDELNARLRVALRHAAGPAAIPPASSSRSARARRDPREVTGPGPLVDLTPREFEILRVLLSPRAPLTKGRLLRAVWGEATRARTATSTSTRQLRRKLAAADPEGALRDLIVTEPGVGYRSASSRRAPPAPEGCRTLEGLQPTRPHRPPILSLAHGYGRSIDRTRTPSRPQGPVDG